MRENLTKGIVALANMLLTVFYLLFVGFAAASIVAWTAQFGVQPLALFGGIGLFAVLVTFELSLVLLFEVPAPFIVAFLIPVIIGVIAVKRVADSKMIRELIQKVEATIRTPPYFPLG